MYGSIRIKKKSNQYCLYCGVLVGKDSEVESNKEHLIGRQFVPTGSFQDGKQFNFIFRACEKCNSEKAELERHVSSVTMINAVQNYEKPEYVDRAIAKASSDYHPGKQGVLVKDAVDTHVFEFNMGPMNMKFEASSPPQVVANYIQALSFYHVQGLFSLITSRNPLEATGTNLLPENNFLFHGSYNHHDWGNIHLTEVSKRAAKLQCCAVVHTADGNFKAAMFRSIKDTEYWFWALEWNKYLRVIGGIMSQSFQPDIFKELPEHNWMPFRKGTDGSLFRIKKEIPLQENNDIVFAYEVQSN